MSKREYCFSIGLLFLFLLQNNILAAQTPAQSTPTPETGLAKPESSSNDAAQTVPILIAETGANQVHYGDLIDVDIIGSTEYDWRGNLSPEGFLSGLNFVGEPIYGLCRTEEAIAADIAKGFSNFLKNPQVSVKIIDRSGRPVSLLYGAIKTPQRFQIQRPVRLNELLILSGGITEKASGDIQILRPPNLSCESGNFSTEQKMDSTEAEKAPEKFVSAKQEINSSYSNIKISDLLKGQPAANPMILSGDIVTVLEAEPIYLIGGVANPKYIHARSRITLSRAIAAVGGFTKDADPRKITVFRREKNNSKIIEVDFEKIKNSATEDIILQAFDVVDVAQTGREKRKLSPIVNVVENNAEKSANLPLRIID